MINLLSDITQRNHAKDQRHESGAFRVAVDEEGSVDLPDADGGPDRALKLMSIG